MFARADHLVSTPSEDAYRAEYKEPLLLLAGSLPEELIRFSCRGNVIINELHFLCS